MALFQTTRICFNGFHGASIRFCRTWRKHAAKGCAPPAYAAKSVTAPATAQDACAQYLRLILLPALNDRSNAQKNGRYRFLCSMPFTVMCKCSLIISPGPLSTTGWPGCRPVLTATGLLSWRSCHRPVFRPCRWLLRYRPVC